MSNILQDINPEIDASTGLYYENGIPQQQQDNSISLSSSIATINKAKNLRLNSYKKQKRIGNFSGQKKSSFSRQDIKGDYLGDLSEGFYDGDSSRNNLGLGSANSRNGNIIPSTNRIGTILSDKRNLVDAPESPDTIRRGNNRNPGREPTDQEIQAYNQSMMALDNFQAGTTPASIESWNELRENPLTPENQENYDSAMKPIRQELLSNNPLQAFGRKGKEGIYGRQILDAYNEDYNKNEGLGERLINTGNASVRGNGGYPSNESSSSKTKEDFLKEFDNIGGRRDGRTLEAVKLGAGMFASSVSDMADFAVDSVVSTGDFINKGLGTTQFKDLNNETLANMGFVRRKDGSINNVIFEDSQSTIDGYTGLDRGAVNDERKAFTDGLKSLYNNDNMSKTEKTKAALSLIADNPGMMVGLTAESIGFLASMRIGGGSKFGSVTSGNKIEKIAKLLGNTGKTTKGKTSITAAGVPYGLAETNKNLEERRKITNESADLGTVLGTTALSVAASKMDYIIDKGIFGGKSIFNNTVFKSSAKVMKDTVKKGSKEEAKMAMLEIAGSMLKITGKRVGQTSGAITAEAATEIIQEAMTVYAQRFGTDAEIFDDETIDRLIDAGILGAAGAGPMTAVGQLGGPASISIKNSLAQKSTKAKKNAVKRAAEGKALNEAEDKAEAEEIKTAREASESASPTETTESMTEQEKEAVVSDIKADDIPKGEAQKEEFAKEKKLEAVYNKMKSIKNEDGSQKYSDKAINSQMEEYKKQLNRLGISTEEDIDEVIPDLLETRETNIDIVPNDDNTFTKLQGNDKELAFDVDSMPDEVFEQIGSRGFKTSDIENLLNDDDLSKLKERIPKAIGVTSDNFEGVKDIYKATSESTSTALDSVINPNNKNSNAKKFKAVAITLSTIKGAIEAEFNVNKKAKLGSQKEAAARREGLNVTLGKKYMNSYGLKLAGTSADVNSRYAEIGNAMLQFTKDNNYITQDKQELSVSKLVNPDGSRFSDDDIKKNIEGNYKTTNKAGGTTDTGVFETFSLVDNENTNTLNSNVNSKNANIATFINKLIEPANNQVVGLNPSGEDVITDGKVGKEHQKNLNNLQYLENKIKPEMMSLLKQIKDAIKTSGGDFDKAMQKNTALKDLLGIEDQRSELFEKNESGRNMGKKDKLRNIVDQIEYIDGNSFFFTYKSAINQRIHLMETILDFQGDKYMARKMITGGDYSIDSTTNLGSLAIDVLVESIAEGFTNFQKGKTKEDDLQLAIDDVLEPKTDEMKYLVDLTERTDGQLSIEQLNYAAKKVNIANPFELLSYIGGVNDIRKAKRKDGKIISITSDFMTEFDGSASGVVNTLLNLSGDQRIQEIIKKLSFDTGDGFNEKSIDAYKILEEAIFETEQYKDKDSEFRKEMDDLQKIKLNSRELSKYVVMTWFYGQSDSNVEENMSVSIATELVQKSIKNSSQLAVDKINSIVGSKKYSVDSEMTQDNTISIKDILENDFNKVVSHYSKGFSSVFVANLNNAFPGVEEYRTKMKELFKLLEATGSWEGTIRTAVSTILDTVGDGTGTKMSTKKQKQFIDGVIDGTNVISSDMFNNQTSFMVNLQHSVDAALMIVATNRAIAKANSKYSVMTVYDASYTRPDLNILIKEEYEKLTVEVAMKYDFIEAAMKEVEDSIENMSNKDTNKNVILSELDSFKKKYETDKNQKAKNEFLSNVKSDIYGSSISRDFSSEGDYTLDTKPVTKKSTKKNKSEPKKSEAQEQVDTFIDDISELSNSMKSFKNGKFHRKSVAKFIKYLENMDLNITHSKMRDNVVGFLNSGEVAMFAGKRFDGGFGKIGMPNDLTSDARYPGTNKEMTKQSLIEILSHEIDHATTYAYTLENKSAGEVKYIKRALRYIAKKLPESVLFDEVQNDVMPIEVASRISYLLHSGIDEDSAVSEYISILKNEPKVAGYLLGKSPSGILGVLQKFMDKVRIWLSKMTESESKDFADKLASERINFKNTAAAFALVERNAKVYGAMLKEKENIERRGISEEEQSRYDQLEKDTRLQKEIFDNSYSDPLKYLNEAAEISNGFISDLMIVLGDGLYNKVFPKIKEVADDKLGKYNFYQGTLNLIDDGFSKSEFARKMKVNLNLSGDFNEKMMNDLQQQGTEIMQETNDILTISLPELDKKVKKEFSSVEDQVKLFKIFSKTGFAGLSENEQYLKDLLSGDKTISEMIADFESRHSGSEYTLSQMEEAKKVAMYNVYADEVPDRVNFEHMALMDNEIKAYGALIALKEIKGSQKLLVNMNKSLRDEIIGLTFAVRSTSDVINLKKKRTDGKTAEDNAHFSYDFDGSYTKDIFDKNFEYKIVNKNDLKYGKYTKAEDWIILKQPSANSMGIVARETFNPSNVKGVGLNQNKFFNGFFLDKDQTAAMEKRIQHMNQSGKNKYLKNNGIITSDGKYRVILDEKTKVEKLGLEQNVAQSLWRSYAHNKELIESQSIREIVTDQFTKTINNIDELKAFSKRVKDNDGRVNSRKRILEPFLKLNFEFDNLDEIRGIEAVVDRYITPKSISTHNGFRNNITLVRKDMSDILVGHEAFSLFGDKHRTMAKYEKYFKELIVLSKMHMVVTAPLKLLMDLASNVTILSMNDISFPEMYRGFTKGFKKYNELSKLRAKLVEAKLDAALQRDRSPSSVKKYEYNIKNIEQQIRQSDFYDAFKYGFVQSYSTDLVVKEFDSIAGLQKDINSIVDHITTDKDGNANEVKKAIKWWMNVGADKGFTVDQLIQSASKLSIINDTKISDELVAMSKRLKNNRNADSVAAYVSNIIGAPSSEIVGLGGATMVITDALSKYTLAQRLMAGRINPNTRRPYTKEEAYLHANKVFIDYRQNLPSEVRAMSDYGILMFPAFWMKIQSIIAGLIKYRPLSSVGGYVLEDALGAEGANILDSNVIFKVGRGTLFNTPGDSLGITTIFPFL